MKFRYRKIPDYVYPSKRWISRPLIQVRLFNGHNNADVLSLIDSGADDCLFHSSLADILGIDMRSVNPMEIGGITAGETIDAYFHPIELQIQGFSERISIQAGFTDSDAIDGLLGQRGFFDHYQVRFEGYKKRFEINYPPAKGT